MPNTSRCRTFRPGHATDEGHGHSAPGRDFQHHPLLMATVADDSTKAPRVPRHAGGRQTPPACRPVARRWAGPPGCARGADGCVRSSRPGEIEQYSHLARSLARNSTPMPARIFRMCRPAAARRPARTPSLGLSATEADLDATISPMGMLRGWGKKPAFPPEGWKPARNSRGS